MFPDIASIFSQLSFLSKKISFVMNFSAAKSKSTSKAEAIRGRGCKALAKEELYQALLLFNKCLCLAEPGTNTLGLAYANRSEVFFKLKLFDKCLNNIDLARNENCLKETEETLKGLEENSLNHVFDVRAEAENPWDFFKLSHTPNGKLPNVVNCLEVKSDKKFGRFITTNQPLKVGDIVAIEKPFFKILKVDPEDDEYPETNVYQYCANCLSDNLMDLIPCPGCLTTMFCSQKCLQAANKSFHKYECRILQPLNETGNWRMTMRCFFDALSICDDSVEKLEELMKKSENLSPTIFNFDFSDASNPENAVNQLMCMLSLERRVDVNIKDFSSIFLQHPKLAEIWSTHREFVNKFLERMMQIEILNFHGIKGRSLNKSKPYRSCLGDGGYAFCSLLNHSCCPNTMRIVVDNRMVLIVERPIKKGDQLFDCYIG